MSRRARRAGARHHLLHGLGLLAALAALVAVQVLPKLEDYTLRSGGSPAPAATFAGASWRLISLAPAQGDDLPPGTKAVIAVLGVTPRDRAASEAISEGCDSAVRDDRDRVWTTAGRVTPLPGLSTLCTRIDKKTYKPILARPGAESRWQAAFVVPADAVSSLRVEVRLPKHDDFVRLAPSP
ncbi:hypothetical protein OIE66_08765 [Nonomuraea sp. NBC_01738]|uniref:hypothetical protein n=1 Tax=Nonomuraea sp. NBC_01738 TaxID=2976003 RepID=UPI002E1671A3|nr:hypothetical protein OIE66_08765 [Nonomuraea sp. NBC_01738]